MKKNFLLFLCAIGFLSYQCAETKKYDDSITINVPEQFLFVGKNKPMITVTGSKVSPVLTLISKGSTDAEIVGSDSIKVSQPGTIKVKITVENAAPVEKELQVVKPNYLPVKISKLFNGVELGYTYNPQTQSLLPIHEPSQAIGNETNIALYPPVVKNLMLYIDDNSKKFTEKIFLFGKDLLKVGTYVTEVIAQTDSVRYTFTYEETGSEGKFTTMTYNQNKITGEFTATVDRGIGAALIYKKQE